MPSSGSAAAQGRSRRRWAASAVWFVAALGSWALWVAASTLANWVAGACVAAVTALAARAVAARGLHSYTFRRQWLTPLARVPLQILVDFGIVMAALARAIAHRSRAAEGGFVARPIDAGGDTPLGVSWRAFVGFAATWSPNCYVVDVDRDENRRLNHTLVPHRPSESPS